jgi:hypothetical protein
MFTPYTATNHVTLKFSLLLLLALVFCACSEQASAQTLNFEKLLMPGKLHDAHAELESECESCHTPFEKADQSKLCIDCHEAIASDLLGLRGFHGKSQAHQCMNCHSEHLGREAAITSFDPANFDHELSDFPLQGKHSTTACKECHATGERYREATRVCNDCHQEDNPHNQTEITACKNCHNSKQWQSIAFDHHDTDFHLKGKHKNLSCHSCHLSLQNFEQSKLCNSCHALDDAHKGTHGKHCRDCHNENDWQQSLFNHKQETGFPLLGRHSKLECNNCHNGNALSETPGDQCIDCHAGDDPHLGRFSEQCNDCHDNRQWKIADFSHALHSRFELKGAHKQLRCEQCHTTTHDSKPGQQCADCHSDSDPHRGSEGLQCDRCHRQNSWHSRVAFDHDITPFPLIGLHAGLPCESCHLSAEFSKTESSCQSCHQHQDIHEGRMGDNCHTCHTPNDWQSWQFDHTNQTAFPLQGAHEALSCDSCHTKHTQPSGKCGNCHESDDRHEGAFGAQCGRCHTQNKFNEFTNRPR